MDVFTFVVVVVLIGCGSGVLNNFLKNKREMAEIEPPENVYAELDELRKRIETLETIVTDEKHQLAKQINGLERRA